jgi:serine/threonine-protein kinase
MTEDGGLLIEQGLVIAQKYLLDRPAGFGGMAQLWVAKNLSTDAEVCVKLLVPDPEEPSARTGNGGHEKEAVERFRREAHAAARLSHRAIVRVFDLLELDEKGEAVKKARTPHAYAIVMELLHGESLGDTLAKRGKLPLEEALDLILEILSALGHAHRASVIHRDLKPDNIFLATEPDGRIVPKVLDFGLSKLVQAEGLTLDGVIVGTPSFMSPEQAKGAKQIDARSDVFSAGILFYMMLSGRNPFEDAPTLAAMVEAVLRRQIAPLPDVPPPIWAVIARSTEKDPAQRYRDGSEMASELRKAAGRKATLESDHIFAAALHESAFELGAPRPVTGLSSSHSSTSVEVPSDDEVAAARRRRIVMGVGGAAGALAVVGLVAVLSSSKSDGAGPDASRVSSNAGAASVEAPATGPSPETAPAPHDTSESAFTAETAADAASALPTGKSAVPAAGRPTSLPRRGGGHHNGTSPTSTSRQPGEEPHNARDPGF